MTAPVCLDRGHLLTAIAKAILHWREKLAGLHGAAYATMHSRIEGLEEAKEIVGCQFRVTHEVGTCVWTHTMDRDAGMVKYESQCGHVVEFYETVKGMEFRSCPFCACDLVEEED